MTISTVAVTSVGAIAVGLFLLRRWRASKWGVCKSNAKLNGKVIIVTGGNVGLGAEAALDFAKRGATVVLACRSFDNSKDTIKRIRDKTGNNDVHFLHIDLGNLASIRQFVEDFQAKYSNLYALVCNAGVWYPMEQGAKTSDAFEAHAGINHLGHFLLTNLLLDKLADSAPSRVVVVSSMLSSRGKLDFTEIDHFKDGRKPEEGKKDFAPTGYCDSKLMNVLFTKELSRRVTGRGITAVSLCPGWCLTSLARHTNIKFYQKILFLPIMFLFMRSAASGAQNIIHAVVEDKDKLVNGGFYKECKLASDDDSKMDGMSDVGLQLWEISENLSALK